MSVTFEELTSKIEEIAPLELQESWDNSGVQLKMSNDTINNIMTTLEITDDVVKEALEQQIDVIITHHPLIFGREIKCLKSSSVEDRYIISLIKEGVSVYSSHTPFDKVKGGNNDYLASLLGLNDVMPFFAEGVQELLGRKGLTEKELSVDEVAQLVAKKLQIPKEGIVIAGNCRKRIKTIGICTGAGGDLIELAHKNKCDIFVTGDVKYHQAQKAVMLDMPVIDAGHFGTEKAFSSNMCQLLKNVVGDKVKINPSLTNIDPFSYL